LIGEPVTLPVLRDGLDELERLIARSGVARPVINLEATGSLHRAWAAEIERRWPGSLRLFAPSETTAARAQLGSRRFKTDDGDCAALIWLLRQGAGRPAEPDVVAAMLGGVRHRAHLVDGRRVLQQRLHDQLNALCPALSAPRGHGRALEISSPTGQAVLACAAAFEGRPPSKRSLLARAPGRLTEPTAGAAGMWRQPVRVHAVIRGLNFTWSCVPEHLNAGASGYNGRVATTQAASAGLSTAGSLTGITCSIKPTASPSNNCGTPDGHGPSDLHQPLKPGAWDRPPATGA
jgi:hypothetical protein